MMHLSQDQIVSYRARSLDAGELLFVSDHLAQCEDCRARVQIDTDIQAGATAIRKRLSYEAGVLTHLTYDQIAACVDGRLSADEAQAVEGHARECPACSTDLREIRQLKAEMEAGQRRQARPGRMAEFWRAIRGWQAIGAFAAAAACLLAAILFIHSRPPRPVAKVEPLPPAAPSNGSPALRDGNRAIAVLADGSLAGLDGMPDRFRDAVVHALAAQRVSVPAGMGELAANRSMLMGESTARRRVDLVQPVGIVVETQRPVFRWKAVPGAEYQVSVFDSDFRQVAESGWIRDPEWRASADLRRGVRYVWQLTVRRGGGEFTVPEAPEPEARFRVLDAASEADLARVRNSWSDSHLAMGVAYAQAGLLDEAKRELQALADQNPEAPQVAALLASVNRAGLNSDRPRSK